MASNNYPVKEDKVFSLKNLSKTQKTIFFSFTSLFLLVIVLGFWQIKSRVSEPFEFKGDDIVASEDNNQNQENLEDLDTDEDGLSDYDEVFLYGTSKFLKDTDSDGISDYDEIFDGTDPNCPKGGNCFGEEDFFVDTEEEQLTDEENNLGGAGSLGDISVSDNVTENDLEQALAGEITADELRELLIQSGAQESMLNQISDEDLLESYQEVLNNQNEQ